MERRRRGTGSGRVNPLRNVEPSPRVRMAALLWLSGAVRSKREASAVMGLHPQYLTMLTNGSEPVKRMVNEMQEMIENESIDTALIIRKLGRKALGKLDQLMDSPNDGIALRAAQDLADRAPETQKTQKVQVDSFSLGGEDAKEIAAAMVEAAKIREQYARVATEGLVELDTDKRADMPALPPALVEVHTRDK